MQAESPASPPPTTTTRAGAPVDPLGTAALIPTVAIKDGSSRESTPVTKMTDAIIMKPRLAERGREEGPFFLLLAAVDPGEASALFLSSAHPEQQVRTLSIQYRHWDVREAYSSGQGRQQMGDQLAARVQVYLYTPGTRSALNCDEVPRYGAMKSTGRGSSTNFCSQVSSVGTNPVLLKIAQHQTLQDD
jgi:hypothetical protein